MIKPGDVVVCIDDRHLESDVKRNFIYRCKSLTCDGHVIELEGYERVFATSRFKLLVESETNVHH